MKTEKIKVSNIKCSGCINTVVKGISEIKGVTNVSFHHDENVVLVDHNDEVQKDVITAKLKELGYPEVL